MPLWRVQRVVVGDIAVTVLVHAVTELGRAGVHLGARVVTVTTVLDIGSRVGIAAAQVEGITVPKAVRVGVRGIDVLLEPLVHATVTVLVHAVTALIAPGRSLRVLVVAVLRHIGTIAVRVDPRIQTVTILIQPVFGHLWGARMHRSVRLVAIAADHRPSGHNTAAHRATGADTIPIDVGVHHLRHRLVHEAIAVIVRTVTDLDRPRVDLGDVVVTIIAFHRRTFGLWIAVTIPIGALGLGSHHRAGTPDEEQTSEPEHRQPHHTPPELNNASRTTIGEPPGTGRPRRVCSPTGRDLYRADRR